jgi:Flp pilus assembly protein TadD
LKAFAEGRLLTERRRADVPDTSGASGRTPETHVIDFRAAEQLLAAQDPRGAVKLLDAVIAAHPENTAARLLRARAFFAAAQLRPAELEFTVVLEREPDNAYAHFALGRTYERQGRHDQARRHFRLAAALDPRPDFVRAARFDPPADSGG